MTQLMGVVNLMASKIVQQVTGEEAFDPIDLLRAPFSQLRKEIWVFTPYQQEHPDKCRRDDELVATICDAEDDQRGPYHIIVLRDGRITDRFFDATVPGGTVGVEPWMREEVD